MNARAFVLDGIAFASAAFGALAYFADDLLIAALGFLAGGIILSRYVILGEEVRR